MKREEFESLKWEIRKLFMLPDASRGNAWDKLMELAEIGALVMGMDGDESALHRSVWGDGTIGWKYKSFDNQGDLTISCNGDNPQEALRICFR